MVVPILQTNAVSNQISNATSTILTEPSGIVDDDIIIALCSWDGSAVGPNISGFQVIGGISSNDVTLAILWKRASAESGPYTLNWTGSQQGRFMMIRVSGCVTIADPIEIVGAFSSVTGTTINVNAITTLSVDTLAICLTAVDRDRVDSADGFSDAQGFTEEGVSGSSGGANGSGLIVGQKDIATEGDSGSPTFGTWASDQCLAQMFNLRSIEPSAGFAHSQATVIASLILSIFMVVI